MSLSYRWSAGSWRRDGAPDLAHIIGASIPIVLDQQVIATRRNVLPSLAAQGYFTYRIGRLIGAARTGALVVAVALA